MEGGTVMDQRHLSLLIFSGEYDKALAAFILANSAREMDMSVTMFFAFWGLTMLRDPNKMSLEDKTLYEKMFSVMTPAGARELPLSNMNMAGLGKGMLVEMMKESDAPALVDFVKGARHKGVNFKACRLSMEVMGLKPEELLPEVEVVDATNYLEDAMQANIQLFI